MKANVCTLHHVSLVAARALVAGVCTWALVQNASADLTHRYSFNTDNDASDSVGGANGALMNGAAVYGGSAYFSGSLASGPDCDYIELPAGLIDNYTSATFELWIDAGANGIWPEIYALGNQNAGGAGAHMVMFCPHSGSGDFRMSYAQADPGYNDEYVVNGVGTLDNVGPTFVACVYDPPHNTLSLYTNGVLVASLSPPVSAGFSLAKVRNVRSWLGRSLYNGDASYTGSLDEFRIFNTALGPLQIAVDSRAGPDTVVTDIAVSSVDWSANPTMVLGSRQSTAVTFNTVNYGSITLKDSTEATYATSDPAVVAVNARGQLFAMGVGTATVSATFGNQTKQVAVQVVWPELIHRYSFTADANDSVGTAHGTLVGTAAISNGAVEMTGAGSSMSPEGYVDLPNDLLSSLTTVTLEAWVTDKGSAGWARIWDFGNSAGGEDVSNGGTRYMFLSLPAGGGDLYGAIHVSDRAGGDIGMGWANLGRPPVGQKTHIVWVTDVAHQRGYLYANGTLVGGSASMSLTPADIGSMANVWLGRSQYNDPMFNGAIDEFRIWNGPLTALQVALNTAAGPDKTVTGDPGQVQSVRLTLAAPTVVFGGMPVQATLMGDFQNQANVNLTSVEGTTFQSGDASIATISAGGVVEATGLGTVTLTGSYGGKSATVSVATTTPEGYTTPTLVHRYSFSEAPGSTTVKDSVGTADGTIMGVGAAFDGAGQLILPGGTGSAADPIAGYVDLPNGMISVLKDLSIEAWITWQGSGAWQRIFDFGTSSGGEDLSTGGGNYLFLSPAGGTNLRFSVRDPVTNAEPAPLTAATPLATGQEICVTVVYDYTANVARLYSNAVLVARGPAPVDITTINDVNNWLGRSQWNDAMFQGKYNEFRIWDGVLLPDQVAAQYAAGPDSLEPKPKLAISVAAGNVVIAWPAASTFALEATRALGAAASWSPVDTSGAVVEGSLKKLTVTPSQAATFYRMKK
jgi:hypothetical protein